MVNLREQIWEFKYIPKNINEMIFPVPMKKMFSEWIESGNMHNCLLVSANPGCGKTTFVNLVKKSEKFVCIFINGSRDTSIDIVRQNITNFVSTVSISKKSAQKIVLLDEADRMSANALDSLKSEIELKINNARFIFTANRESAFPDPIKSRLKIFNFDKIFSDNKTELYTQAMERACYILDTEKIKYDKKAVAMMVKKFAPDWRNLIKNLQLISAYNGKIELEDVQKIDLTNEISNLIVNLKEKNFDKVREFSIKNIGNEIAIMQELYKLIKTKGIIEDKSKPALILILADLNRYINVVPDPEIEIMASFVQIMAEIEFI